MSNHTKTYRIAAIPGDGIGIEVVEVALEVLQTVAKVARGFTIEATELPWGSAFYKKNGYYLPPDFLSTLKEYDAILFGAVGAPGRGSQNSFIFIRILIMTGRHPGSRVALGSPPKDERAHAALCQYETDPVLHQTSP